MVFDLKFNATRQRFAPKELVIPTKGLAEGVRIPFFRRRVRPKVEGCVDFFMHEVFLPCHSFALFVDFLFRQGPPYFDFWRTCVSLAMSHH